MEKLEIETLPQPIKIFVEGSGMFIAVDMNVFFDWIKGEDGETTADPAGWGVMLADVLMHVAKAHTNTFSEQASKLPPSSPQRRALTEEAIRKRILNVLLEEVKIGPSSIRQVGQDGQSS
jgi:hypothetical protein